jgi:hypothetical protein
MCGFTVDVSLQSEIGNSAYVSFALHQTFFPHITVRSALPKSRLESNMNTKYNPFCYINEVYIPSPMPHSSARWMKSSSSMTKIFLLTIATLGISVTANAEWTTPSDNYTIAKLSVSETEPSAGINIAGEFVVWNPPSVEFYINGVRDFSYVYRRSKFSRAFRPVEVGSYIFTAIAKDSSGIVIETLPPLRINVLDPRPEPIVEVNPPSLGSPGKHHGPPTISGTLTRFGSQIDNPILELGTSLTYGTNFPLKYGSSSLSWNTDTSRWLMYLPALAPDTVYHYRISYQTAEGLKHSSDVEFRTPLNTPPPQMSQSVVLGTTNGAAFYIGSDVDGHPISIVSSSALQYGTLNGTAYTAGPNFPGSETFTITTTDGYDQTTSTVRVATSEWYRASCFGNFESFLVTDTNRPAGTISVSLRPDGTFTGKLTNFGAPYSFKGNISAQPDDWPSGNVEIERFDNLPFVLSVFVNPDPSGSESLGLVFSINDDQGYSLYGAWAGQSSPPPPDQIGQTNMIIPAEVGANPSERPQGTGFGVMKVARKGAVRWIGRSGDNQPFSVGAKYNASRSVNVFARVSRSSSERIYGTLRSEGQSWLQWYKPERPSGAYSSGFISNLQPVASRFEPYGSAETMFDTATEVAPTLEFKAYDHSGAVVASQSLQPGEKLDSGKETPGRVKLKINRKTGLFAGEISKSTTNPKREKVSGIILPNARMGSGVWRKSGSDAKVFLAPVAE